MHTQTSLSGLLAISLMLLSTGCGQVDELIGGLATAPSVSYSSTTIDAEFYTSGSSPTPSIDWNGDQGTIALGTTVEGLSINSTTGKLSWTKLLPPGTHEVDVIVSNSEGQVVTPITIQNPLQGQFVGTYDGSHYYAFDFAPDGTVAVAANSKTSPDTGTGTWTQEDDEVIVNYVYDLDASYTYSFKGTVTQNEAAAEIVGDWYTGVYEDTKSPSGDFELELE